MTYQKIADLSPTVTVCQRCNVMIPDGDYNVCSECARQLLGIANYLNRELVESRAKLRDQFAMAALTVINLLDSDDVPAERVVEITYAIADAMLAEREKGATP